MTNASVAAWLASSLALVAATVLTPISASSQEDGWAALKTPGTHILMRHAIAPGTGDPENFKLGDCSTQRNLDEAGRAQAKAIGAALKANGVAIDIVLTSQWCRARDTADLLGAAPVEEEPALNSFFADRDTSGAQTDSVKQRLAGLAGRKVALVSHQVNITALTDVYPASGEMIVISLGTDGEINVKGRIRTE